MCSLLVSPVAQPVLIVAVGAFESVERQMPDQWMFLAMRECVREAPAGRRRRLESLVAPAAIEIEVLARRSPDEWTAIRGHILDTGPMPQHSQPRNGRDQRDRA